MLTQKMQMNLEMQNHNKSATEKYEKEMSQTRKRSSMKAPRCGRGQRKEPIVLSGGERNMSVLPSVSNSHCIASAVSAMPSVALTLTDFPRRRKKPKLMRQPSLSVPTANGVALMAVMVASFLQSNALAESLNDCSLLHVMIEQAQRVPLDYKPPLR